MSKLTHFDETGRPVMVDVSSKDITSRIAVAKGKVRMSMDTLMSVKEQKNKKGNVEQVAELAGIMAAKNTSNLIPLCHPIQISKVSVQIDHDDTLPGLSIYAEVKTDGKTGAEMEALTAVSISCLTIYDMLKSKDKHMTILDILLESKSGGKSGNWKR